METQSRIHAEGPQGRERGGPDLGGLHAKVFEIDPVLCPAAGDGQ